MIVRDVATRHPWVLPEQRALEPVEGESEAETKEREAENARRAQERVTWYFGVHTVRQDANLANLVSSDGSVQLAGSYQLALLKSGLRGADVPAGVQPFETTPLGEVTDAWLQQFTPNVRRQVSRAIDRFNEFGDGDREKS